MILFVEILIIYFMTVFVFIRFFIPHFTFEEDPLPEEIPSDMKNVIEGLSRKAESPKEFLELSYEYVGNKYHSQRLNVILKFNYLFKSLDEVWKMEGYMPCTQSSFVLRIFLVKSGFFKDSEVKRKHIFVNFITHQYLEVKLDGKWVSVDVGEKQNGMPIGKHLNYFSR